MQNPLRFSHLKGFGIKKYPLSILLLFTHFPSKKQAFSYKIAPFFSKTRHVNTVISSG